MVLLCIQKFVRTMGKQIMNLIQLNNFILAMLKAFSKSFIPSFDKNKDPDQLASGKTSL